MPVLSVRDLVVEFPNRRGVARAVDGVSFEIDPGEVLGLVGESGAGKSLTGAAIVGLLPPPGRIAGGAILLDGERIDALPPHRMRAIRGRRIGMIFQDPLTALNPLFTVGQQLIETMRAHLPLSHRQARERAIAWLAEVGIAAPSMRVDAYPNAFSGGMRQRVAIAIALLHNPDLLIADEPTTALDVTVQAQILRLLMRLRKELGMALLLITHDFGVIAGMVERVNVMLDGEIVESGPVGDVFASPRHSYTRALLDAVPRLDAAGRVAR